MLRDVLAPSQVPAPRNAALEAIDAAFLPPDVGRRLQQPLAVVPAGCGPLSRLLTLMTFGAAGFGLRDNFYAYRQFDRVPAP